MTHGKTMLVPLAILVAAGIGAVLAGCVLWWAAHRGALWNFAAALILGVLVLVAAILIGYVMVKSTDPF